MPELAKSVVLRVVGDQYELSIDGEAFPWHIAKDTPPQPGAVAGNLMPTLTITLLAECLEVEHDPFRREKPSGAVASD